MKFQFNKTEIDRLISNAPVSAAVQLELDKTVPESFETVSKNLRGWASTFAFTGDELTSVTYESGGSTIVKTFVYTDGDLTSIALSGDTPSGIELTKTLTYSEDSDSVISIERSL